MKGLWQMLCVMLAKVNDGPLYGFNRRDWEKVGPGRWRRRLR